MIIGIGVDLVEIPRLAQSLERQPRLPKRILSPAEYARYINFSNQRRRLEFLAGRFAVKEALSKALGTGIGKSIAFQDIHCDNDSQGKPYIVFDGYRVHVSISHTDHYAVSQVILEQAD